MTPNNKLNPSVEYSLSGTHILIQKIVADIILNLEALQPGTYAPEQLEFIKDTGKSRLGTRNEDYHYSTDSYWHERNLIDDSIDFHFGWDFDRYWFEPLGDIFGMPGKQIENLAANVIAKEWGIANGDGYNDDPRVNLWNQSLHERATWHDHGNYPRTDNLAFYLSYHSMLVVAARVIDKMPIILTSDWRDNEWEDWLSRHLLTCEDGKWLADYRDALPLVRPTWITGEKNNTWQTDIREEDFLNCLKVDSGIWLAVDGKWHERHNERTETYSISSALVSKETSDALLRALTMCSNPYEYNLPYYKEEEVELQFGKFSLKGWIQKRSIGKYLDKFDPYADEIIFPPYSIGDEIMRDVNLTIDKDNKLWIHNTTQESAIACEIWSSYRETREDEPHQSGVKLKASLSVLQSICKTFDCDLIFDVQIERRFSYKHGRGSEEYHPPMHKTFILSENGRLRTIGASYQLG